MDAFRALTGMSRYQDPVASVPASVDVEHSGSVYRFGAPWPWFVVETSAPGAPARDDLVQLAAPRQAGEWPVVAVEVADGGVPLDESQFGSFARSMARARNGRARPVRRLRIDGARAADFSCDSGILVSHLVLIPVGQKTATIEFESPSAVAAGYEVHLDTMLATWRWL